MTDLINHPPHYTGTVECIDALESIGIGPDFCRGNAIKYLWRMGRKGDALEDARKAQWYLNRLIVELSGGTPEESPAAQPPLVWDEINSPTHYAIGYLAAGYMDHRLNTAAVVQSVLSSDNIVALARACRREYSRSSNDEEQLPWE